MENQNEYRRLADVFHAATQQAAVGKGRERHAGGKAFERQPIFVIPALLGATGSGFLLGQAMKKISESIGLADTSLGAARAELLGAINYLAAEVIRLEDQIAEQEAIANGR